MFGVLRFSKIEALIILESRKEEGKKIQFWEK